jgi:hypothetical protein
VTENTEKVEEQPLISPAPTSSETEISQED